MNKKTLAVYELLKEEDLTDIHSKGMLLRHRKTGARVMLIQNDDENKVFNIAFRTPPTDSTGAAHILEHSVLCGSREFPLKDPFVELVKGSMNTFLNAMTYPDKTCYPAASCNDQDFQNLMHVYLDAVFYPNIYKKEEIFRQEGWSYHLESEEGPLTYNGVVYNEMKGVFSSPDDVLEREIMNSLFPDTAYGCESGGDPDFIPDLTYEQFLDFHRKYYHPSNSYIYLYGNMDMDEKLAFIDEHYLSSFDALLVESQVREQPAFDKCRDITREYAISENEGGEGNTYLSYNMVVGKAADTKQGLAFEVLDYALLNAPGAPLKKALLDAGVGKDIYGSYDDGILQPYFSVVAKGSDPDKKEEFLRTIRRVLEQIVSEGIDQKAVQAGINYLEFQFREADYSSYPKGLMYGLDVLGSWLYDDKEPFACISPLAVFEELKEEAGKGYFENLIQKRLLENSHGSVLMLTPSRGLAARREGLLEEKLEACRAGLTDEERKLLVKKTADLEAYQEAGETDGAQECIPMLKRSDIKKEAAPFYNQELDAAGSLFLYHEVCTNGIGYVNILFDLKHLAPEKVPYLGLLKSVMGYVDTENYTYGGLFNEINANTGGIQCGVEVFERADSSEEFRAMFSVRGKALYGKLEFLFRMMKEIINTSSLADTNRLYEIVAQTKSRAQASLISAGHSTAVLRASSYDSPMAAFQDDMAGIGYYRFVEDLEQEFDNKKEEIVLGLKELMHEILRAENVCISYTGERESLDQAQALFGELKGSLSREAAEFSDKKMHCEKKNEGFMTSGQVQYVARCGNFRKDGYSYTGALDILKVILGYDYLWTNIRVKGGAYGCMSGFRRNGESFFVSYRDPNLRKTLDVYEGIPAYLEKFRADEREMTKYIIGAISGKDTPRTPYMKGNISEAAYFCGVTEEMVQAERDQILNAGQEDIRRLAGLVRAILADNSICVVGSESAIRKEKALFGEIKSLISG